MDITSYIDDFMIPIITVCALCVGFILKKWMPTDDKWIPTILWILGAASGILLFGITYEGIVKGMVSGLAAVGLHQAFHQHLKLGDDDIQQGYNIDSIEELCEDAEVIIDEHDCAYKQAEEE